MFLFVTDKQIIIKQVIIYRANNNRENVVDFRLSLLEGYMLRSEIKTELGNETLNNRNVAN
jgi:hypothetical protein